MKLPIGISSFKKIREGNYLYVDKSDFALRLIEEQSYVFLSRPRRFGKSLFLDTLKEIFEGNREIFKGLAIHDRYAFEKYPVIKIAFGGVWGIDRLERVLFDNLNENQKRLGVVCNEKKDYSSCFRELIQVVHEHYNQKVVVLVDEYDKPILDNIDRPEEVLEIREKLKEFYTELKENDAFLRFAFLTGVSKFARVSIFSGLNNLNDISLDRPYAALCGYTQRDIETTTFRPLLDGVDMEKFRTWYNGYNFNGENVYNPFDVLLFISKGHLYQNYWFSTGTPGFLIKLLKEQRYFIPELENLRTNQTLIDNFDVENIRIEPVLFQSGYLTLDKIMEKPRGGLEYQLKFPNLEVQVSFNDIIIDMLTGQTTEKLTYQDNLFDALHEGDMQALKYNLHALYAGIPYNYFTKNNLGTYEGYYASVFYAYIASLGLHIIPEDITNRGRIDFTLFINNKVYIFEFKVADEKALKQIKERRYFEKYLHEGKEITIAGITFDENERNISEMKWEIILV